MAPARRKQTRKKPEKASKKERPGRPEQLVFEWATEPSKRRFPSGKKMGRRKDPNAGVPHDRRPVIASKHPVFVTLKLKDGLPPLRHGREFRVICRELERTRARFGMHLAHFVVMSNHLHLIVELDKWELLDCDRTARRGLSSAMNSLNTRLARALNKLWGRTGQVFADRYHARAITNGKEMKHVLEYVLKNAVKAGLVTPGVLDPFSSADTHPYWEDLIVPHRPPPPDDWVNEPPRTWTLRGAWRRYGELSAM